MKILYICKSKIYSGAENVVCTVMSGLSEGNSGIYFAAKGTNEAVLKKLGVEYELVDVVTEETITDAINRHMPDVVHANDFSASYMAAKAIKKSQKPDAKLISHIHNNPPWIKSINPKTLVYASVCKTFSKILLVSESVYDEYVFRNKLKDKYIVVGNPFDKSSVYSRVYDDNKNIESIYAGEYNSDLLFVGRLTEQKDPLGFIRLVNGVKSKLSDKKSLKAIMVGAGEMEEDCKALIKELGLEDTITMTGFVDNPYLYMAATKVQVMLSKWEGFGLVALEAFTFSKPVLARKVGGLKDIVTDKEGLSLDYNPKNDKTTDSDDSLDVAVNEAVKLLSDDDYYTKKSKAAAAKADEYDNVEKYIKRLEEIYES